MAGCECDGSSCFLPSFEAARLRVGAAAASAQTAGAWCPPSPHPCPRRWPGICAGGFECFGRWFLPACDVRRPLTTRPSSRAASARGAARAAHARARVSNLGARRVSRRGVGRVSDPAGCPLGPCAHPPGARRLPARPPARPPAVALPPSRNTRMRTCTACAPVHFSSSPLGCAGVPAAGADMARRTPRARAAARCIYICRRQPLFYGCGAGACVRARVRACVAGRQR